MNYDIRENIAKYRKHLALSPLQVRERDTAEYLREATQIIERLSVKLAEVEADDSDLKKAEAWMDRAIKAERKLAEAEQEIKSLRAFKRSVDEALNSGDGSYRP